MKNVASRSASSLEEHSALGMGTPNAAYIHIPFCRRRCYYCDFPIAVVGDKLRGETSGAIAAYINILCREIIMTPSLGAELATVFFGGGTPSLLAVNQVEQILAALEQRFDLSAGAEISMEIDPGTFTLEQLQGYWAAGVNRVSLGAQAFQPELLAACGRSHTVEDIYTAVAIIQAAGFTNFNLDLISGLPAQTLAQWQSSLAAAVALAPTHLSIYDLTIEPVTAFGRRYQPGVSPLPTDETTATMYRLAAEMLRKAGYEHYEISNYARARYQCRHNRVYWQNQPYYGFGMGATSYTQQQRFTRPRKRQEYFEWVEALESKGGLSTPQTTGVDLLLETLMVGLRLAEGISLEALASQFGEAVVQPILDCLAPHQAQGWVELPSSSPAERRVRLSDPEGFLFSNLILVDLWTALENYDVLAVTG